MAIISADVPGLANTDGTTTENTEIAIIAMTAICVILIVSLFFISYSSPHYYNWKFDPFSLIKWCLIKIRKIHSVISPHITSRSFTSIYIYFTIYAKILAAIDK